MTIDELIEGAAAAVVIRPGDSLVLRMTPGVIMSREQLEEYADQVRAAIDARMNGVGLVVIAGADQMLVYRPDEVAS